LLEAITYKNYLRLCFFKYFLVKYFKYLFENAIYPLTVIFLSSLVTLSVYPVFPVLPPILILLLKNSAKLEVLKTLSSTGLEQSMVKLMLYLAGVDGTAFYTLALVFVAIIFNLYIINWLLKILRNDDFFNEMILIFFLSIYSCSFFISITSKQKNILMDKWYIVFQMNDKHSFSVFLKSKWIETLK